MPRPNVGLLGGPYCAASPASRDPDSPICLSCGGETEGNAVAFLEMPARGQRSPSPQKTMLAQVQMTVNNSVWKFRWEEGSSIWFCVGQQEKESKLLPDWSLLCLWKHKCVSGVSRQGRLDWQENTGFWNGKKMSMFSGGKALLQGIL